MWTGQLSKVVVQIANKDIQNSHSLYTWEMKIKTILNSSHTKNGSTKQIINTNTGKD